MRLQDWVKEEIANGRGKTKTEVLRRLESSIRETGDETVSFVTLQNIESGLVLKRYPKALAIELATDGKVTAKELCGDAR